MATLTEKKHELLRKRQQLTDEFAALVNKDHGEADQPAEDVTRLDAIETELKGLKPKIDQCDRAIELQAATARPLDSVGRVIDQDGNPNEPLTVPATARLFTAGNEKGFKAARFMIGMAQMRHMGQARTVEWMMNRFGDEDVAKALNTTGVSTGGALIPQAFLPEVIELLRARVVVRSLQPMIVPMPLGNLTIPRLAAGAQAGYQGELDDIAVSQETFDDVQLNAKKLTALVPVSNDLIRRSPIGVETIVRDDLIATMARREDIAMLRGDGSGGSVIGILNQASAANKLTVAAFGASDNATVLTAVVAVLNAMRLTLEQGMSREIRPAWIFPPSIKWFLAGLRDQVGNFVFKDEIMAGTLMGIPYRITQQLPDNLTTGSGANGAEMYLVDFADIVLGETYNMAVDASDVASYKDAGGTMVSTYQRDQTLFRVIEEHDLAVRHQASIVIATCPAWIPPGYTGASGGRSFFIQALTNDSSAAPSTWGAAPPTGSNNPGNVAANAPGGTQPGRP